MNADEVDKRLHYFYLPSLDMDPEATAEYESLIDEVHPELILFDSWIGFLARCGFDENSPTQVEQWANAYVQPAKSRGITTAMLDHIPHDAIRARGATRKTDLVDVQWHLKKQVQFDRDTVGFIRMTRRKDREAWLPQHVGFSVGGTPEGFVMARSEGTFVPDEDDMPVSASKMLEALKTFPPETGAPYEEWRKSVDWNGKLMPDSTFRSGRDWLIEDGQARHVEHRYYSNRKHRNSTASAGSAVGL